MWSHIDWGNTRDSLEYPDFLWLLHLFIMGFLAEAFLEAVLQNISVYGHFALPTRLTASTQFT